MENLNFTQHRNHHGRRINSICLRFFFFFFSQDLDLPNYSIKGSPTEKKRKKSRFKASTSTEKSTADQLPTKPLPSIAVATTDSIGSALYSLT